MNTAKLRGLVGQRPPKRNEWCEPEGRPLRIWIAAVDAGLVFEVVALYELLESTPGQGLVHGR